MSCGRVPPYAEGSEDFILDRLEDVLRVWAKTDFLQVRPEVVHRSQRGSHEQAGWYVATDRVAPDDWNRHAPDSLLVSGLGHVPVRVKSNLLRELRVPSEIREQGVYNAVPLKATGRCAKGMCVSKLNGVGGSPMS